MDLMPSDIDLVSKKSLNRNGTYPSTGQTPQVVDSRDSCNRKFDVCCSPARMELSAFDAERRRILFNTVHRRFFICIDVLFL